MDQGSGGAWALSGLLLGSSVSPGEEAGDMCCEAWDQTPLWVPQGTWRRTKQQQQVGLRRSALPWSEWACVPWKVSVSSGAPKWDAWGNLLGQRGRGLHRWLETSVRVNKLSLIPFLLHLASACLPRWWFDQIKHSCLKYFEEGTSVGDKKCDHGFPAPFSLLSGPRETAHDQSFSLEWMSSSRWMTPDFTYRSFGGGCVRLVIPPVPAPAPPSRSPNLLPRGLGRGSCLGREHLEQM